MNKCKNMERMNEKWNYAPREYYYVYGVLYSFLCWLPLHIKTNFQNKAKTNLRKISATSCRDFSLAKFCQVRYIIKKKTRTKKCFLMNE